MGGRITLELILYFYTYDGRALIGLIWLRTESNVRLFRIRQPNVGFLKICGSS